MSLRPRNGKWEYRFWLNGVRVSRLTDWEAIEENRTRAEKAEQKHRDQIVKGDAPAKRQVARAFSRAVDDFLAWVRVEHREKPNTIHRVETSMVSARVFFGNRPIAAIRPADVERYKVWRLTGDDDVRAVQPITLRHDLDNLSKLFKWAKRMDLVMANPLTAVTKPSAEDAVRMHVLTAAEEFLYFERARAFPNLYDVARIMLLQGMRPEEVMRLERGDVDLSKDRLIVRRARRGSEIKGKSPAAARALRMAPETRLIVERRLRGDSRWLFPSPVKPGEHITKLNNSHDKACAPAQTPADPNPARLSFVLYDLRHTFATRAAENGMPIAALAKILGHSNLRSISKYVHPSQEEIDAAMERYGPMEKAEEREERRAMQ